MFLSSSIRSDRAPARELAQRMSGTTEVVLFWHPNSERVELAVRDRETGIGFSFDVEPGSAMDAFYHPYAYAVSSRTMSHASVMPRRATNGATELSESRRTDRTS